MQRFHHLHLQDHISQPFSYHSSSVYTAGKAFDLANYPKSAYNTGRFFISTSLYRRRPRRPPFLRVESDGSGVTSSIRPIFMPARASARRAAWPPGPSDFLPVPTHVHVHRQPGGSGNQMEDSHRSQHSPPVARILICSALIPCSLHRAAASWAASMAA